MRPALSVWPRKSVLNHHLCRKKLSFEVRLCITTKLIKDWPDDGFKWFMLLNGIMVSKWALFKRLLGWSVGVIQTKKKKCIFLPCNFFWPFIFYHAVFFKPFSSIQFFFLHLIPFRIKILHTQLHPASSLSAGKILALTLWAVIVHHQKYGQSRSMTSQSLPLRWLGLDSEQT